MARAASHTGRTCDVIMFFLFGYMSSEPTAQDYMIIMSKIIQDEDIIAISI